MTARLILALAAAVALPSTAARAATAYDPAAKFDLTVTEVQLRQNQAGRMPPISQSRSSRLSCARPWWHYGGCGMQPSREAACTSARRLDRIIIRIFLICPQEISLDRVVTNGL